jgi:hypothetical protein
MPFTRQTASIAGKKSKRGKNVLDYDLKENLKINFYEILKSLDKKNLTSTEKLKFIQLSINYILPKISENKFETQESIKSILFMPADQIGK